MIYNLTKNKNSNCSAAGATLFCLWDTLLCVYGQKASSGPRTSLLIRDSSVKCVGFKETYKLETV